jgi:hypothetical protein
MGPIPLQTARGKKLPKMGSHKKQPSNKISYSTQPKHISKQQLGLKSKTNGKQIPRRNTGRPQSKETVNQPKIGMLRSPILGTIQAMISLTSI